MAKNENTQYRRRKDSPLLESSKTILANIRFSSIDNDMKTLVVTSTGQNEGKSTIATNLAIVMASSGKKTLLVDADMRRRSLAQMLGIQTKNGLYAALTGAASMDDIIISTRFPRLSFMDVEPNIPSPPDILSSKAFHNLVERLRVTFDYVLFDTPPVSLFVDAAILASFVDGTLFVIKQGETKRNQAQLCVQQLRQANAHLLGSITNFSKSYDRDYYYYYGESKN